ncbi:hypothetical protein Q7P35_004753 [Cladosporium inversicolor]
MDNDNLTISSLTTEPDNLIELYRLSGLPTTHDSRRLESGFLIRADRLPNCVPLPGSKIERRSWIWLHVEALGRADKSNNPRLKDAVPKSHNTVNNWIKADFNRYKSTIVELIRRAVGKVTISFNGWKANNDILDLLGVVVHYISDDLKLHNVVLAMRDTLGSHTGANISDNLFDVLKDYQISSSQIAHFAADNASNNDKALELLSEHVTLDPVKSRLRCAGHIYNLVCTTILFGVDDESLKDAQFNFKDEELSGKLYNLVMHIKANNRRRGIFKSKQIEVIAEGESEHTRILRVVTNGGIRWNSTYLMIKRAIDLKDALTLYQDHDEYAVDNDDRLTKDDYGGALHTTLTSMDYLISTLENRRNQPGSKRFIASLVEEATELERYKNMPETPEKQDPLDWWILHQDQFPMLRHLAFTMLAAPTTRKTHSERAIRRNLQPHNHAQKATATQAALSPKTPQKRASDASRLRASDPPLLNIIRHAGAVITVTHDSTNLTKTRINDSFDLTTIQE